MTLTLTATATTRLQVVSAWPPDTTLSYSATPVVSLPGLLSTITDPTFGTRVTRVSDVNGQTHYYSNQSCWSLNDTWLLLGYMGSGAAAALLDGSTFAVVNAAFPSGPANGIWSNVNADKLYVAGGAGGNLFMYRDVTDPTVSNTIETFTGYAALSFGGQGSISDDDRYIAFTATFGGANRVIVYDQTLDSFTVKSVTTAPHWVKVSPSGTYCLVRWTAAGTGAEQGTWQYPIDVSQAAVRQLWTDFGHGTLTRDANGDELYVVSEDGACIAKYDLASGTRTVVQANGPNDQIHIGGVSRWGWVVVSNYDSVAHVEPGTDDVYALKLDGSETVQMFAKAHHGALGNGNTPTACPSRDGTKVAFSSEWDASDIYEYVAQQ